MKEERREGRAHLLADVKRKDDAAQGEGGDDDRERHPGDVLARVEVELVRPAARRQRRLAARPTLRRRGRGRRRARRVGPRGRDDDLRVWDHALERGVVRGRVQGRADEEVLLERRNEAGRAWRG